jgi:hypothetical protein
MKTAVLLERYASFLFVTIISFASRFFSHWHDGGFDEFAAVFKIDAC